MNNSLCFVGPHRKYNPFGNQYHELVPGQGHFGPDAIPGVSVALHSLTLCLSRDTFTTQPRLWIVRVWQDARWRRGESVSLKMARDNMVSLEAAAHAQMFLSKR